jgi:hypothetical protein
MDQGRYQLAFLLGNCRGGPGSKFYLKEKYLQGKKGELYIRGRV